MGSLRPRGIVEYLQILWRRKALIFLFATAMLIATYTAMSPIPDVYEAKASIAISLQSSEERTALDVQVATVNQYLLSRSNLEPIVRRYDLYGPNANTEIAVGRLRSNIILDIKLRDFYPQFPESFTISYKHTDPAIAMKVTNDLASFFNNTNEMMEKRAAEEVSALNSTIAEIEGRLRQINQQRAASMSSTNLNAIRIQRASLIAAIDSLSDKEYGLNQQIAEQKRQINEQERLAKASPLNNEGLRSSSAYGVLLARKAQLEAELKDLTSQYTDKNTKVISKRTEIAEVNRQIGQLESGGGPNGPASGTPELRELRSLQRDLARLETDLEVTQRDLTRKRQALAILPAVGAVPGAAPLGPDGVALPTGSSKDIEIQDEYNRQFSRYNTLAEQRDALLRRGAMGGVDAALFRVVDRAILPQFPVAPNRLKLMAIAFVMALGVGLMAALFVEIPRMTLIQNELDVEYLLGAPVVALIPETLTSAESGRRRRLSLVRGLGVLLFAALLIPALALLLMKLQVFQLLAK